jgi:O-antigen ligase
LLFLATLLDPTRYLIRRGDDEERGRVQRLAVDIVTRVFLIVCLIAVLIYGVGWIGGEPVVSNLEHATTDFTQQQMDNNANTSRKEIWSATWRMIKANPIAGVGFGGYWIAIARYHQASGQMTPQQAHNDYLEIMAAGGLIGLALVAWFAAIFIQRSAQYRKSESPYSRGLCVGALTGVFGVGLHSFVDFGLHITVNAIVVLVLITVAVKANDIGQRPS